MARRGLGKGLRAYFPDYQEENSHPELEREASEQEDGHGEEDHAVDRKTKLEEMDMVLPGSGRKAKAGSDKKKTKKTGAEKGKEAGTDKKEEGGREQLLNISQEQEPTITADMDFSSAVAQFEKNLLETTLKTSGNLREAGKKLNINASTISRKIKQYNIDYPNKKE